jgi:succinyl-diaminopimelate desuccinylase
MQTQIEATLAKLISIPSVTNDTLACREILDFVRSEIIPLGLFIEESGDVANPWFYATTRQTKTPEILLAAHLDVVPASPELYVMQKRDGKLYGRGVYDMKVAAACYIEFLKSHANELRQLDLGVLFTTDEEGSGQSTADALETGLRPKVVFLPDGGDNWSVEKRAKGLHGVELIARGKTAHGSRPWEGENALHNLLDALHILRSKYPSVNPSSSTLAVNKLHAGEAANQVAGYASAQLDFRSFSKEDLSNYKLLVAELAKTHNLEVKTFISGDPLLFDATAPSVQGFLRALRRHTGNDEVQYCESYGASDGRYFAKYNVPCIIIEPFGGGRHAASEWLKADDLSRYYQLIEQWLVPDPASLTSVAPSRHETATILG